jgi:hypothetical protein
MNFGEALQSLNAGHLVARKGWNGKEMYLRLVGAKYWAVHRIGTLQPAPWIGLKTADGYFVPWTASQTDILAEDWEEV